MKIAKMIKVAGSMILMALFGFSIGHSTGINESVLQRSLRIYNTDNPDDGGQISLMDTLLYRNFESNSGAFMADHDWQWGVPTNPNGPHGAHSGTKVWAVGLTHNYSVGPLISTLTAPSITFGDSALLSFWHWYATEDQWDAYDGGNLKISADSGATWTIITPVGGYDGTLSSQYGNPMGGEPVFFGNSGGWVCDTFDLSNYDGDTVLIKFDFGSDENYGYIGWFVDDYLISGSLSQSADEDGPGLPQMLLLCQNYPNPFNARTMIRYVVQRQSMVTIDIFDIMGRKIQTLTDSEKPAGEYQVVWDAGGRSSGTYFYRIKAGDIVETRRMTLIK